MTNNNFENRKIHVLEAPTTSGMYRDNHFDQQTNAIWKDFEEGHISVQALALWFYLNKLAGHDREVYCKIDYLISVFKTSKSSVQRWTKELETTGWLVKNNRTGTSNKYWIAIPAEFDTLDDTKYQARLSTVGQELLSGKRSTKKKEVHSVTDEPMKLDITNSSHSVTSEPINSVMGEPMHSVTSEPLNRETNNQRNLEPDKTGSYQGVTYKEDQGSPLVDTNEPLVSSGKTIEEIDFSLADTLDSPDSSSPLVETNSPGYSSVTKKEEISTSSGRGVNEDDLEKKRACSPGYRKNASFVKKTPTKPLEVVDAPQSLVEANGAPKVQEIPEKPQKPVQDVPQRSQYDTDSSYEKKVWNAQIRQGEAVRKWKQDLVLWESTYGANASYAKPEETYVVTDEFKAQMTAQAQERMRFRAQGY